jgi:hypothetical protein
MIARRDCRLSYDDPIDLQPDLSAWRTGWGVSADRDSRYSFTVITGCVQLPGCAELYQMKSFFRS